MAAEAAREATGETSGKGVRVEATELSRRFGDQTALDRLSLVIEPGEAFGLLGANGAGKTTFIRCCTGYLLPSAGEVRVDGLSPAREPEAVRRRLGFVAETSRLYPDLRVASFLRFAAGVQGLGTAEAKRAVADAVGRFQLEDVLRRPIGQLSKGFQQRVSLAQAFLRRPPLLIVDEPTGGLDPLQQEEVRSVLRDLHGQQTLILCTHDLNEARELTERVAVLRKGRLVALGPTDEVLGGHAPLELFRGSTARAETLS